MGAQVVDELLQSKEEELGALAKELKALRRNNRRLSSGTASTATFPSREVSLDSTGTFSSRDGSVDEVSDIFSPVACKQAPPCNGKLTTRARKLWSIRSAIQYFLTLSRRGGQKELCAEKDLRLLGPSH